MLPTKNSSKVRVQNYRRKLRRQGLRPVQIWVMDVRSAKFASAARRQSKAVGESPYSDQDQAFVDTISEWS